VTNSPLVVSFTNGIRGAASIRCYSSCEHFLKEHIELVNNYRRVLLSHFAASGWFLMVLVYVGYIVNMFCIGFCMFSSSNDSPASIGLLLAYILNMNDEIYSFVLEEAEFETQLISLERLYHITQLPPEKRYTEYCKNWKE
jgi:ATP-binding cassette, subfamily C (CFTR/MRP), member 1